MEKYSAEVRAKSSDTGLLEVRRDASYWLVIIFAGVLTFLWPAALIAFLLGILGSDALLALPVEWKVAIAVGALALIPAIWLTAYTWIKARDLAREARFLARQANRFLVPEETASDEIKTLGQSVQQEVKELTSAIQAALARVQDLEASVQQQSDDIESAGLEAENRAQELRRRMEKERDRLKSLADDLTTRTDAYSQKISSQAEWMSNLSDEAFEKFNLASDDLSSRSKDFSNISADIAAQTLEMGASIEEQSRRLKTASDHAFERSESTAKQYEQQRKQIEDSTERLDEQNSRLERVLENQRDVLAQIAIVVGDQSEVLQSSVAKCAEDLQAALDTAVKRAEEAAHQFRGEVETTTVGSEAAVAAMVTAAKEAGRIAAEARTALDEESSAARKVVEQQASYAKDMVNGLFAGFESSYRDKAKDLQNALGEETGQFKIQIEEANKAAQEALSEQATQAFDLVAQSTSAVEAASTKLGDMLEALQSTSLIAADSFAQTADKIESHVETFPDKADHAAAHIRMVLDEELNAFSRLADEAGRKIQNLSAAVGRHLPGMRSQISSAHEASPYRSSPYQSADLRGEPSPLPTPPKSEWAWRELLANIEPPADGEAKNARQPRSGGPNGPSESELNKSAVLVFESLQSMAVDIDKALEANPPADLLRRYLNGEKALFTKRIVEMTNADTSQRIHDRYLEDGEFRHNVNQYIEQFEGLLGSAVLEDHEDILLDTFLSSHTGKVYLLLGSAVGHFS